MENEIAEQLWKKVRRYIGILQIVPFVRMISVCNNLAFGNVDEKSDIDLFVIAKKGRLFIVRSFVTFILHIFGVRRHGDKVAGRFCLSFFVDDTYLDLSPIAINHDIYLAFWIKSMKPVIDDGVSGKFLDANQWAAEYFERKSDFEMDLTKVFNGNWFTLSSRRIFEFVFNGKFGDFVERKLRTWQQKRARDKSNDASENASLVIDDHILKFHNIDRRRKYRNMWFVNYGKSEKIENDKFLRLK